MSEQPIDLSILGTNTVPSPFLDAPRSETEPPNSETIKDRIKQFASGEDKREKRSREKESAPKVRKQKGMFVKPLTEIYTTIGSTVFMLEGQKSIKNGAQVPESPCGTAILESAEKCAEALDELAYQNEAVRKALFALTQTSAMGTVLMAHAPIIMTVLTHHMPGVGNTPTGRVASDVFGVQPNHAENNEDSA